MKTFLAVCMVVMEGVATATAQIQTVGTLRLRGGTYAGQLQYGQANGQGTVTWMESKYLGPETNAPTTSGGEMKP